MKRWLKRLGICLAALMLGLLNSVAVEHIRGRVALDHYLNFLRSKGEELSVSKLEPRRPPDKENACIDLVNLTNKFEAILLHPEYGPPSLRSASPGKAIVAWRLKEWIADDEITDWDPLASQLDNARELLNLIHSALAKPAFDTGFDYSKGFDSIQPRPIMLTRKVVVLLNNAALFNLKQGNLDAANRYLTDAVRLTANQSEPLIIDQLVRYACAAIEFNQTWQALQAPGWKDSQLAALQSAWNEIDFVKDMERAVRMERAMTIDLCNQLRRSKATMADSLQDIAKEENVFGETGRFVPGNGIIIKWAYVPFWRLAWADQDELRSLQKWQVLVEDEKLADMNSWATLVARPNVDLDDFMPFSGPQLRRQLGWYDRLRFLFSNETSPLTDKMILLTLEAQVQQQMAVAAIAIYRYRLQTGKLPADLSALVPKYLPALPRDGMDGKTLRYKSRPDGSFLLYSVGEDGKDDGGDPSLKPGKDHYGRIWDGRDAVWPTAAPDQ